MGVNFIRYFYIWFGLNGMVAILFAAYASHSGINPYQLELINKASNYQLLHSIIGMFAVFTANNSLKSTASILLFSIGIICFSYSLYLKGMGIINSAPFAPIGGICYAFGHLVLGIYCFGKYGKNNTSS